MSPRRRAALGLWAALTFSSAVIVHGVVHAVGSRAFVWDSPAHAVMLAAALGLLAAVAAPLGLVGPARERRRRLALVRAGLGPVTPGVAAFGLLTQALVAALLLLAENAALEPERLGIALLCGLVALVCSAFLFRATRDRVFALLVALAEAVGPAAPRATFRRRNRRPLRAALPYRLFRPNRPPPAFAA
ncbi:MAG: hypothetical protein QOD51_626 [Candidatus Eremiobacteraeota bacterium]|jgi:hypothetical protein|nr:hypothetical protein [Candidatus Eremiobacteraeota bacterium]